MSSRILVFSHLTPDERIELAEQLWDSLPVSEQQPTGPVVDEIRWRRVTPRLFVRREARADMAEAFR